MKKKKIKIVWSCSNYKHHEHEYKFTAYLYGRLQYVFARLKNGFCVSSVVRRLLEDIKCRHIWTASMFTSGNYDYLTRCIKCGCERIEKVKGKRKGVNVR